jgi:predicted membrane-bound dolichyl-phosphate-mannose-protein mannosyltransferase
MWAKNKPSGYSPLGENKVLLSFEKVGQMLTTATALCFSDTNLHGINIWLIWFFASALLMIIYELYWVRYFIGGHTLKDFYRTFFGIPLPGATLPIAAFIMLGIYGKLIWLVAAAIILGIGHIGIHLGHLKKLKE